MKKVLVVLLSVALVSCVFVSKRVDVTSESTREPIAVKRPVKAHLNDGSTVVYSNGVTVTTDALVGAGVQYNTTRSATKAVQRVPLSDVIGMESFSTRVNAVQSIALSTVASGATALAVAALAVALFGSCPTVYSDEGVEEAELFSNSLAPLLEGRDVDRLDAQADPTGLVTLEVRNEAMETHYINHLQLLEVAHAADERVVTNEEGTPLVIGQLRDPVSAVNRRGRDVHEILGQADGRAYATERDALDAVSSSDVDDWIDLAVPIDSGTPTAAIAMRLRNSLLATTLLYDVMLAPAGAAALDWIGGDLARISTAVELGRWHQRRAGLRVAVWRDGGYHEVARVPDSGPIMWDEVGVVIPVPAGEPMLRLRLSFVADHWRLDQVRIGFQARPGTPRAIPLSTVTLPGGNQNPRALDAMRASDDAYLETSPGQTFAARFDTGPEPGDGVRTFLISAQGYYIEWIRSSWIRNATTSAPFKPTDDALLTAIRGWAANRESFEKQFTTARVPVR